MKIWFRRGEGRSVGNGEGILPKLHSIKAASAGRWPPVPNSENSLPTLRCAGGVLDQFDAGVGEANEALFE